MTENDRCRVLIVDDHAAVRRTIVHLLDRQEWLEVAAEAEDGVEALDAVEQLPVDVVVMDVSMPRLNGIETTRRLASERPGVLVIGMSVYSDDAPLGECMREVGATDFITKARVPDRLIPMLWERCSGSSGESADSA